MLDTATSGVQGDLVVRKLTSTIVDVPTVRKHKLSQTSVTAQNYVIVRSSSLTAWKASAKPQLWVVRVGARKVSKPLRQISIRTWRPPYLVFAQTASRWPVSAWTRRLSETTPRRRQSKLHSSMPWVRRSDYRCLLCWGEQSETEFRSLDPRLG